LTERDAANEWATAIDVDVHFSGVKWLTGGVEEGVDNLFGSQSARSGRGEEGRCFLQGVIICTLIGVRVKDESGEVF
jgi:hypothetical protein